MRFRWNILLIIAAIGLLAQACGGGELPPYVAELPAAVPSQAISSQTGTLEMTPPVTETPAAVPGVPSETTGAPASESEPTQPVGEPAGPIGFPTAEGPGVDAAKAGQVVNDITYCVMDGYELKMDVYYPEASSAPVPGIVYVHGGGWSGGDKRREEGVGVRPILLREGYLIFSINYRLAPDFQFPAMIEDVKCAVRYLRSNAAEYGLDANRIGVMGRSSGGQLVSLTGTSDACAGFDTQGGFLEQSSRVQAVVDMYGAINMIDYFKGASKDILQALFGTTDREAELIRRLNPMEYITPDDPPFLIIHGDVDRVVPPFHSQDFYNALVAAGVPAELVWVKNAGHGLSPDAGVISPSQDEVAILIRDFFNANLRDGSTRLTTTLQGAPTPAQPGAPAVTLPAAAPTALAPTVPLASPTVAPFSNAKLGAEELDLTYCVVPDSQGGGVELKMDVFYPFQMSRPAPVVVYIHGGGWSHGDKGGSQDRMDLQRLRERGFLIVTLNYRLAPEFKFPAQIQDVKCAIRHLRANAAAYNLDPQRIGAMGESAGGHLSALLGLTDAEVGWDDVGGYYDQSSHVQAVVDLYGPADLSMFEADARGRATAEEVFGVTKIDDPMIELASPVSHITPDGASFLILQGDQDELVPVEQSQVLYDRLVAAGVPATLVIVKNAGHGFGAVTGPVSPSTQELARMIIDFFVETLK
jgi:acetyl esterase/lipase